jgi:hypothetical protein
MPRGFELKPNICVVEDFAVIGNPDRIVFIGHGLAAGREIDDAEAAVPESNLATNAKAGSVRPAMRNEVGHSAHDALVGRNTIGV